jgi:hypothetical protein
MRITIEIGRPRWLTTGRLKRARPLVVVLLLALVFAAPVLAFDRFTDVGPGVHHDDISAIAAAGITQGCNPPTNDRYCPADFVRRDQMGSFLARAAGLGTNPPVANADKLDGIDAGGFLPADDYAVMQWGPWHASASGGSALTIAYFPDVTRVGSAAGGDGDVLLALDGPASVGGIGYGFASARICFSASSNVTIDQTIVYQSTDTSVVSLYADGTDRPMGSDACYTVSDITPNIPTGGTTLLLDLEYVAGAIAFLKSVTTTWTPVSP